MDFENKFNSDCFRFNNNYTECENEKYDKNSCCVKRIETYYCCPSYYNEEKKEERRPLFYEGTFKLYPNYCDDGHTKKDKDDCTNKNNTCRCNCRNRCGFCGLFGRRW